jgi:hypothetical protein
MKTIPEAVKQQLQQELNDIADSHQEPQPRCINVLRKMAEIAEQLPANGVIIALEILEQPREHKDDDVHAGMMSMIACDNAALIQHTAQCLKVLLDGGTLMSEVMDLVAERRLPREGA